MGVLGCDNRLLFDLRNSGIHIFNCPWEFRTVHNHSSQIRNYGEENRLKGNYMWLRPTRLYSFSTILIYLSTYSYRVTKYLAKTGLIKIFNRNY